MPSRACPAWLEGNGNDCYAGYVFSVLAVTLQRQITFHNGLMPARAEPKLFLAEKLNKCDQRITGSFKKNISNERRAFYHLNQRILPTRPRYIVFFSPCRNAAKTITFHNGLAPACAEKPKLFLAEESNKFYVIGASQKL